MWEKLSKFILSNRFSILVVFLLLTGFMAFKASQVRLSFSGSKVLPLTDSAFIKYNSFKEKFGEDGSVMVLGVQSRDLFKREVFNEWKNLADSIRTLKGIKQVLSISNLFDLQKDTLNQKFKLVSISAVPVSTDLQMAQIKKKIYSLPFYNGLIVNRETNASLMAITFDSKVMNSPKRIPLINSITEKSAEFSKRHGIKLHYSGLPYIRTVISEKVSQEFTLFLALSIAVAAIILFLFFKSGYSVFFPVILVIIGVVWSLGFLVLFNYDITILTGLIPPLIVIIGIPNSILLLNKYHNEFREHGNQRKAMQTVIARISITTFIANLTTAVGFGVLFFTGSELLTQFGLVASISVMTTWLISLCLIPIIFSYLPAPKVRHTRHLDSPVLLKLLRSIDKLVHTKRNAVYITTLLLVAIAIWGITKININGFVVDDLPQKDPVYQDMAFFEKNFEGVLPLEVTIDTRRKNGVMNLSTIKKIEKLQQMISAYPEFSRAISFIEALKFSSQAFYGGGSEYYRLPNDMEKNFILAYAGNSGGNENMLRNFIDKNRQVTRVSFQMADVGSSRMNELLTEIQPRVDSIFNPKRYDVNFTGSSIIFVKGTDYLITNLRDTLLLALLLITGIMWVLFRGGRMILISLIPNLIPLIITAGIMGFFGIPLKPSTILIFSIALGIASDQTIYFMTRYREDLRRTDWTISRIVSDTLKETGVSMIYVALILFFGFGIFIASTFGGTVALGLLLSITLLVAMISNIILLPSLLLTLEKRINKAQNKS